MSELKGKVAVITGSISNGGIGQGIAEAFAQAGINIVLNGRRPSSPEIEAQRAGLESKHGVKAIYHRADMTRPDEIIGMIDETVRTFGKIDILVNNAGSQHVCPVEEFPLEKWNEIIAVHLTATFVATKAAIPHMKKNNWGRIINISSAHGSIASPYKAAYVAAKHGVQGFTKTVALEVAQDGITCNTISPGYTRTALVEGQVAKQAATRGISKEEVEQKVFMEVHATRQFTTIEEIGDMAVGLCSRMGKNVTGQSIYMDGGWTTGGRAVPNP